MCVTWHVERLTAYPIGEPMLEDDLCKGITVGL